MFKQNKEIESSLNLANDSRTSYARTHESDLLADNIIVLASEKIRNDYVAVGGEFVIEIDEPHLDVHFAELLKSLMEKSHHSTIIKFNYLHLNIVGFRRRT